MLAQLHTNIHVQRYTHILAYLHEFKHKSKPPVIPSTTDNGKMIFVHSGYFYNRLFKFTTTQRRSRPPQFTLCRSLHAKALQATISERLAQGPWLERYSNPRPSGPKTLAQPMCHHSP